MTVLSSAMAAAEGGHHVVNELPFAPIYFGVIALVVAMALLGLLWAFRNTLALEPHLPEGHAHDRTAAGRTAPDTHGH